MDSGPPLTARGPFLISNALALETSCKVKQVLLGIVHRASVQSLMDSMTL
jgi:hypothetical protein